LDFDASAALEDPNARAIYSVSQLNAEVRDLLENGFPLLWVEGELSNLARPGSGHWYFTLKDERAQVRCAMFRGRNRLVDFRPQDGGQILVRARVGLYEPRGSYQLIVEHMEPAGDGALRRAFDQLKNKLQSEGLFDPEHKQTLPPVPRRIGVITSGTGAAVRDVLSILRRRFPLGDVLIFPVPVQGEAAAPAIVGALERAARHGGCDVLIVTRGGGSLEDLWAFNEEAVARAIHACPLPVVSAVGHEVDFTIADFAADVRAPTPSAAAETVSPDQGEWQARLSALEKTLQQRQARRLGQAKRDMERLGKRLDRLRPDHRLQQHMQRLDELETRLHRAVKFVRESRGTSLHQARTRLINASPARTIAAAGERRQALARRLTAVQRQLLQQKQSRMREAWRALHTVSPLATLERGYAIASDGEGRIVRDAASVAPGDALQLRLHRGRLDVSVTTSHAGADLGEDEPKG
jgi:exodeoxyribonuclease VII large subunit